MRQGEWKLVQYPQINETQLCDLGADPHELRNLAAAVPARVTALIGSLTHLQRLYGDALPLSSEHPAPREVPAEQLNSRR